MVSGIYSHEAAVFGSPWTTLGAMGSENWGPQGLEGGWSERGYGMIRSRSRSPRTSFTLLGQAFLSVKQSLGAGGLPLEAEALWLSLTARSLLPSPNHACLSVGSLLCILLGGLPRAASPELWVAQMGDRATETYETKRLPCVLDRQTG